MILTSLLTTVYLSALVGLAIYGWLGLVTLGLYARYRHEHHEQPDWDGLEAPPVTVQLPLYNERYVVARLIRAVAALDYPADRLQIQIIDDSTDDTTERAHRLVASYRRQGLDISLIHRTQRSGFKAGAMALATQEARGEFLAIFDADFRPPPDFLRRTIPHFLTSPRLGVVQTRWTHLNDDDSLLAGAQALALDKHFVIEQTVRHRVRLFPKFNGTAGVWRRACLEEAGGWQPDTLCEDLCASTRALLGGWEFRFLPQVTAPAELPNTIGAYRNQQARWAKGSTQCLRKYARRIISSPRLTRGARLYGLLNMASYATSILLILLLLLQVPLLYVSIPFSPLMIPLSIAGLGQPLLFLMSQQALYGNWRWRSLRRLPLLLLTAIGLSPTIGRAVLEALLERQGTFARTPKNGDHPVPAVEYKLPFDWIVFVELFLAAYAATGLILAIVHGRLAPLFFLLSCFLGFGYVLFLTLKEQTSFQTVAAPKKNKY
ncbi:MAG TPA: glycosyltransferase [Candidatus Sulfomarinibacteraceae bacterium]|nr:glycosyltransferase [Candidatus Sulfomarinibacteraceae bacterium]